MFPPELTCVRDRSAGILCSLKANNSFLSLRRGAENSLVFLVITNVMPSYSIYSGTPRPYAKR
jgi:hypothetical protein